MARPKSITRLSPYAPTRGRVAGQVFTSQRAYENALARAQGLASAAARRRQPVTVRSPADFAALTTTQARTRPRALHAVSLMRRKGYTLARAAKEAGTTPEAVRRYAAPALDVSPTGRMTVRPADRVYRPPMDVITTIGVVSVRPPNSRTATLIAEHWNAVKSRRQNPRQLLAFRYKTFRAGKVTYRFETDPRKLDALFDAGELDFESIYADAA